MSFALSDHNGNTQKGVSQAPDDRQFIRWACWRRASSPMGTGNPEKSVDLLDSGPR